MTGCKNQETKDNNEKMAVELKYMSGKIFSLSDKINNISSSNYKLVDKELEIKNQEESSGKDSEGEEGSKEGSQEDKNSENPTVFDIQKTTILDNEIEDTEIEWKSIKEEIELINNIWNIVSIDLSNAKVADNDIQNFNNVLNEVIISVKNEDSKKSLENISNLYSIIPTFTSYIMTENTSKIVISTKTELLKACSLVMADDWDNAKIHVNNAQNIFLEISKESQKIGNKEYKIDKVQRLLKNLEDAIKLNDKQIFLLHYKVLVENIDEI